MSIVKLNERFERIERAYTTALGGRDPASVNVLDLLPAIFAAVPDTSTQEIADATAQQRNRDPRFEGEP